MASAGARSSTAFPQILNLVRIRSLKRRRQAEKDAGDYRNQESKKENLAADVDFVEPGNIRGGEAYDRILQEENCDDGDHAGNYRQQRALGQQLCCQACAACTHHQPNRNFAATSGRAREKQVRDIHARDKQHKSHGAEKDEQLRPLRAYQIFLYRDEPHSPLRGRRVFVRIVPAESRYVGIELRLRLRDGESGPQTCDGARNYSLRPYGWNRKRKTIESRSEPDFHVGVERAARMPETWRHHPHDCVQVAIEAHFAADDVWIRTVVASPKSIADHHWLQESLGIILLRVDAAKLLLHSQQCEIVRTRHEAFGAHRPISSADS